MSNFDGYIADMLKGDSYMKYYKGDIIEILRCYDWAKPGERFYVKWDVDGDEDFLSVLCKKRQIYPDLDGVCLYKRPLKNWLRHILYLLKK